MHYIYCYRLFKIKMLDGQRKCNKDEKIKSIANLIFDYLGLFQVECYKICVIHTSMEIMVQDNRNKRAIIMALTCLFSGVH